MFRMKLALLAMGLLIFGSCSTKGKNAETDAQYIQPGAAAMQGEWRLDSYCVDSVTTQFEAGMEDYTLSFGETDNSFGMATDCNTIGGEFEMANDTIRFKNMMVTEMACDKMTVEQNMLCLFNDTAAYALCSGDSILYIAPNAGSATFVKKQAE